MDGKNASKAGVNTKHHSEEMLCFFSCFSLSSSARDDVRHGEERARERGGEEEENEETKIYEKITPEELS